MKLNPGPLFRDEFFGSPYKLGGQSKEEGFDCLSFVNNFYSKLGFDVRDCEDLYIIYDKEEKKAKTLMWKRLFKATKKVSLGNLQVGDMIVFKHDNFGNYPGVFLGNGIVGASFIDRGITVLRYDALIIRHIRRWKD